MKSWYNSSHEEFFWYQKRHTLQSILLLPVSWIFRALVALRYLLYRLRIKKTWYFSVPIIVIGNITVGGTGKTPLVMWLAQFLKKQGYRPGIVSRGVGGKKQFSPRWVTRADVPRNVGDEAVLIAQHTHCPLVIGIDRVAAVKELLANFDCDVVIADDGLQHYRLGRDIEIAMVASGRQFGNGCLLPAGPLRESPTRLQRVDFVVQSGGLAQGTWSMQLLEQDLALVTNEKTTLPLENLCQKKVHAVAGIGHPERFFAVLRKHGLRVMEHVFPDHYLYQAADFSFNDSLPIIMTEKDAVKCKSFADQRFWFLPMEVQIDDKFQAALLEKLHTIRGEKNVRP